MMMMMMMMINVGRACHSCQHHGDDIGQDKSGHKLLTVFEKNLPDWEKVDYDELER